MTFLLVDTQHSLQEQERRETVRGISDGVNISLPNLQLCLYESMPDGCTLVFPPFLCFGQVAACYGGTEG